MEVNPLMSAKNMVMALRLPPSERPAGLFMISSMTFGDTNLSNMLLIFFFSSRSLSDSCLIFCRSRFESSRSPAFLSDQAATSAISFMSFLVSSFNSKVSETSSQLITPTILLPASMETANSLLMLNSAENGSYSAIFLSSSPV